MALRDQPYLPLYVKDFQNDEQLAYCSAAATGVYIRLMCIMHRSNPYGKFLLKASFKDEKCFAEPFADNFAEANGQANIQAPPYYFAKQFACMVAKQLAKLMPFDTTTIVDGLNELIENNVLYVDGDYLCQKRMIKDGNLSDLRSVVGKKGVQKKKEKNAKNNFASTFAEANGQAKHQASGSVNGQAKHQANTANENHHHYNDSIKGNKGIGNEYLTTPLEKNNNVDDENFASTFAEANGQAKHQANTEASAKANNQFSADNELVIIEDCFERYFSLNSFSRSRELLCMNKHMDQEMLKDWALAFNRKLTLDGIDGKFMPDWVKHLNNWLNKQNVNDNPQKLFTHEHPESKPTGYNNTNGRGKRGPNQELRDHVAKKLGIDPSKI